MQERYKPSKEDIKSAESMMTEKEKELSTKRENLFTEISKERWNIDKSYLEKVTDGIEANFAKMNAPFDLWDASFYPNLQKATLDLPFLIKQKKEEGSVKEVEPGQIYATLYDGGRNGISLYMTVPETGDHLDGTHFGNMLIGQALRKGLFEKVKGSGVEKDDVEFVIDRFFQGLSWGIENLNTEEFLKLSQSVYGDLEDIKKNIAKKFVTKYGIDKAAEILRNLSGSVNNAYDALQQEKETPRKYINIGYDVFIGGLSHGFGGSRVYYLKYLTDEQTLLFYNNQK